MRLPKGMMDAKVTPIQALQSGLNGSRCHWLASLRPKLNIPYWRFYESYEGISKKNGLLRCFRCSANFKGLIGLASRLAALSSTSSERFRSTRCAWERKDWSD